jgi:hypothetical protein
MTRPPKVLPPAAAPPLPPGGTGLGPLQDLIASLNGFANSLHDWVVVQPNPQSSQVMSVRRKIMTISEQAHELTELSAAQATADIADATVQLNAAISQAKTELRRINDFRKALAIATAVAAAALAVASGGGAAAAPAILALTDQIIATIQPAGINP